MQIRIERIEQIVPESRSVKTFFFRGIGNPRPGNYLMVWIPGSGQIPLSISSFRDGICGLTVKRVCATTEAMHRLNPGDLIGITPPLGSSFSMKGNRILLVSGGIGIAPLLYLALEARALGKRVYGVFGFERGEEVIFEDVLGGLLDDLIITTDDGSYGLKGTPVDLLEDLYLRLRFDRIFSCGPEAMMKRVFDFARSRHIMAEFSLERTIRCGMGICGACAINGLRVCKEGPVFDGEALKEVWGDK